MDELLSCLNVDLIKLLIKIKYLKVRKGICFSTMSPLLSLDGRRSVGAVIFELVLCGVDNIDESNVFVRLGFIGI